MEHILKTWKHTLRFITILMLVFALAFFIVREISNSAEFNVDFKNDKTLVTFVDKKNVIANSVLPACDCWTFTGIEIRPGEEYEIKVSGKIHLTADKILKDVEQDVKPRYSWIGPEGDPVFTIRKDSRYRKADSLRKTLLLNPKANVGQVLFYFQKGSSKKPNCDPGLAFFNPTSPDSVMIYDISNGLKGKNETSETWYLWATVNDMLVKNFDVVEEIAFVSGSLGDSLIKKKAIWESLMKQNYNRFWFDDNFGQFVISAKILKDKSWFSF